MEKLRLKHIAPYLPYGLKVEHEDLEVEETIITDVVMIAEDCMGFKDGCDYYFEPDDMDDYNPIVKLLLRPLSDLVKPLPSGEIPLVELAKIAFPKHKNFRFEGDIITLTVGDKPMYSFNYNWAEMGFYTYTHPYGDPRITPHQLQLFEYLFANHFDVYNLIPADLAVDINSIEL